MHCNEEAHFLELVRLATGDQSQLVIALARRAEAGDFVGCAWLVKKALGKDAGLPTDIRVSLLRAFGAAFSGDSVGHLGYDILLGALHDDEVLVRLGALDCLEHWLDNDHDGRWVGLLHRLLDQECEALVAARLELLIEERPELLAEELDDCTESCPACGNEDIQRYPDATYSAWVCGDCGKIWDELGEVDDEDDDVDADEEDEEEDLRPTPWRHLLEERGSSSRARALLERRAIPEFLERVLDIHPHLTLDLLESLAIGHLSVRANDLELLSLEPGSNGVLRVVLRGGRRGFSIEPTASEDHFLVFTYF
jgi:hypothetical protein